MPMVRILRFAAYELRNRNATVEGKPASVIYVTNEEADRAAS